MYLKEEILTFEIRDWYFVSVEKSDKLKMIKSKDVVIKRTRTFHDFSERCNYSR